MRPGLTGSDDMQPYEILDDIQRLCRSGYSLSIEYDEADLQHSVFITGGFGSATLIVHARTAKAAIAKALEQWADHS